MNGAPRLDGVGAGPRLTPDPSTPQGGERRYVDEAQAVTNVAAGAYTNVTSRCRVIVPSARLAFGFALGFKPDTTEDATIPNTWTATADAWKRTKSGILVRTSNIFTALPMPFTWESAGTIADEVRIAITAPNAPGTGTVPGVWYLVGSWEPNQVIETAELQRLFQLCRVAVEAPLAVSQSGV